MIQNIVNEIQNNKELMEEFESVTAIDDETILIIEMKMHPAELTRIIQDNGYRIENRQDYTVMNGETFDEYWSTVVHQWVNDRMPENISRWSEEGREEARKLQKICFEENIIKDVSAIKIQQYTADIEKLHKEWREKHKNDLTIGKLIKQLEKLDPDTLVFGMDNEYGEYPIHEISKPRTITDCPDCHSCGCVRCNSREMFRRKYIILG